MSHGQRTFRRAASPVPHRLHVVGHVTEPDTIEIALTNGAPDKTKVNQSGGSITFDLPLPSDNPSKRLH